MTPIHAVCLIRPCDRDLVRATPMHHLLPGSDDPWLYGGEFPGHATTAVMIGRLESESGPPDSDL